jgi:hypothetical protein
MEICRRDLGQAKYRPATGISAIACNERQKSALGSAECAPIYMEACVK